MEKQKNIGSVAIERINEFRKKYTKAFYAIIIVLALMLMGGCSAAFGGNGNSSENANQETVVSKGVLSFTVEADKWDTATDDSITVAVTGETDDKNKIQNSIPLYLVRKVLLILEQETIRLLL